jgi:hypothetical protein
MAHLTFYKCPPQLRQLCITLVAMPVCMVIAMTFLYALRFASLERSIKARLEKGAYHTASLHSLRDLWDRHGLFTSTRCSWSRVGDGLHLDLVISTGHATSSASPGLV